MITYLISNITSVLVWGNQWGIHNIQNEDGKVFISVFMVCEFIIYALLLLAYVFDKIVESE